ncbi:serine/threonine protein kinase, partial [Pyxidicoccus fallax]
MKLPSDSDYQLALQNPSQAFSDPELREGRPELGTLGAMEGLPRPRAGNFATVYKLECGSRAFAIRCFTRPVQPDQEARYHEITRHLTLHRLPYSVDVAFLPRGIQVQGQWFPIVKMEWVQGESLSRFVEKHRESPRMLFELATAWVELLADLRRAGVAHGDLQHGNVLVTPEGLRLVDYDGMFVPALEGRRSHERGHANYQHPLRDAAFFDARLDHFSAWVVWLSLVALAHEPGLWERFQGGDDCLLFRKRDFDGDGRSPLFQALQESRHERVRAAAGFFQSLLARSPADVPALDGAALSAISLSVMPRALPSGTPGGQAPPDAVPEPTALNASREVGRFIAPVPAAPVAFTPLSEAEQQGAAGILLGAVLSGVLSVFVSPFCLV